MPTLTKQYSSLTVTFVIGLALALDTASLAWGQQRKIYEPTWESLDQHKTPEWLMDAKLGLFIYAPSFTKQEWEQHHKLHGHKKGIARHVGASFPDHWVDRAWDKLPWDPDGLAQLAADAGAKYIVFARTSFILNHPSRFNDVPGSPFMRMQPTNRDYVDEMAHSTRARGLRFGLYTNYMVPTLHPEWIETVKEAIDMYQPDTLWFDGDKLRYPEDEMQSRELAAYYYNHSKKQDEVAIEDAMGSYKGPTWGKRLVHGDWYRKEETGPHDDISDGFYVRYRELFYNMNSSPVEESGGQANNLIEWLIDCSAKNGNLEATIFLGPPELYDIQRRALLKMGLWLQVNGEAIYGTRPWYDGKPQSNTTDGIHIRYTTQDNSLYAILFKWPHRSPTFPNLRAAEGTTVSILGVQAPTIPWRQTSRGLNVNLPPQDMSSGKQPNVPCDHAYVYKMTPIPSWFPTTPPESATSIQPNDVGEHIVTLQNGKDGYEHQTNEVMTSGQWGGHLGHSEHGSDELFLFDDQPNQRYARVLVRFDLQNQVPLGTKVTRAVLQLYSPVGFGGFNTLEGRAARKPWEDGKTWWQQWGRGGTDPGYVDTKPALRGKVDGRGSHHFQLDPTVVQQWIDQPQTNHGLLLKTLAGDNNFHWYLSGAQSEYPPRLAIEYNHTTP